jgi:prevent-host-death family protein
MTEMMELSATEVRADWSRVLRDARSGRPVTVTQHGEAAAVIVDIVWWRNASAALGGVEVELGGYPHHLSRETLRRIRDVSQAEQLSEDQVVNNGLDQWAREQRRALLREESRAALSDPDDLAELRAVRAETSELRAW